MSLDPWKEFQGIQALFNAQCKIKLYPFYCMHAFLWQQIFSLQQKRSTKNVIHFHKTPLLMVPVEFSIREWSRSNIVGLWTFYVKSFSNISQHGLDIVDWRKPFFVLFNKKRPCPLGVNLYKSSRVNHRVSFIYGVMHTIKHGVCMYFLNTEKRFSWKRFCFRFCRALWYFNRGIE